MWNYEKRLEYPIKIKQTNPTLAAMIISQYGGPDGELGASMRYISQRYSMPYREVAGLLTDIGTEELGHFEMISTMVHQLTSSFFAGHDVSGTEVLHTIETAFQVIVFRHPERKSIMVIALAHNGGNPKIFHIFCTSCRAARIAPYIRRKA